MCQETEAQESLQNRLQYAIWEKKKPKETKGKGGQNRKVKSNYKNTEQFRRPAKKDLIH